ncbi:membrane-associated protein, putative [Bodo saltans]|uniref:Membrane-associated protein, putative n=1 Tax=Bodo saltans TaxID=75058 RepID=A0A0S4JBA0_BODSA|nr:membrane-associated protein, putative [Bodo saltans]|eukprot:CUG87444.1 membrane-associated protein, putative [Bodo saltans]
MTTSDHHHHAQIHNTRVQIQSEGHRKVSRYAAVSVLIVSVVMLFVFTEWRQPTTQGSQPSAMGEALILLPPQAPPHQQATATVVGWDVPLFLHDSFAGVAIDPSYGAELDIACNNVLPAHGTCLYNTTTNSSPSPSSSCLVRYHRAAHLACRANHSDLCPCHQKRIAVVHNVHFIGALKDRMIQHKQFFAVSPQRTNDRTVAAYTWALIDATTPETNGLGCMFGEAWALAKMNTSLPMIGNLSAEISRLQERQTKVSTNDPITASSTKGGGTAAYGSCEWLRDSPRATPPNRSTTVDDSVPVEGQEVFYALESGVTFPGHALSVLVAAIGQYVAEGLDKRGIPWLVPCLSSTQGATVAATSGGSRGSRSRRFFFYVGADRCNHA